MPEHPDPATATPGGIALAVWFVRQPVSGNRWITQRWALVGLEVGDAAALAVSVANATGERVCRACPPLNLYSDEAEGYVLNVIADEPSLFLMLRHDEAEPEAAPTVVAITASFHEAARWNDAGETVERLPLPAGWKEAIEDYARARLKPPEERRPKRRYAEAGDKRDRPGH